MIKHLFIFCCSFYAQAQFAIVNDKDGFVNVREEENVNSAILTKIKNGSVVAIDQEPSNNKWVLIKYDKESDGYIYHDRLKDVTTFDVVKPSLLLPNTVNFFTKEYKITIEVEKFDKKKHTITKDKDIIYGIDGREFFGTDGMLPTTEIKSFTIYFNDKPVTILKEDYANLYNINVENFKLTYNSQLKQYYLYGTFSDGAASFDAIWVLENGKIIKQIAQINFYA